MIMEILKMTAIGWVILSAFSSTALVLLYLLYLYQGRKGFETYTANKRRSITSSFNLRRCEGIENITLPDGFEWRHDNSTSIPMASIARVTGPDSIRFMFIGGVWVFSVLNVKHAYIIDELSHFVLFEEV